MTTELIRPTQDDIADARDEQGTADYDCFCDCPIARAVKRMHPDWDFRVFRTDITVFEGLRLREITLPIEARRFIEAFDDGLPVEPIEFEIEIGEN